MFVSPYIFEYIIFSTLFLFDFCLVHVIGVLNGNSTLLLLFLCGFSFDHTSCFLLEENF